MTNKIVKELYTYARANFRDVTGVKKEDIIDTLRNTPPSEKLLFFILREGDKVKVQNIIGTEKDLADLFKRGERHLKVKLGKCFVLNESDLRAARIRVGW